VGLRVAARAVEGVWVRHVPHRADLLGRASVPADGRWQHGDVVPGLYLADSIETATAEWYRSLAEWGLAPQDHVPYDHHEWHLDLRLADLSGPERLRGVGLDAPLADRRTWLASQRVGEQLWLEGWAGLSRQALRDPRHS
jgi:RES domain-containing protein